MDQVRIFLFGTLRLAAGEEPIPTPGSSRDQAMWAYLLLNRDHPHPRARLAYTFWPDSTDAAARNRLRHALYVIRRALPPAADATPWFIAEGDSVQWNPAAPAWLDVDAFETGLAAPPPPGGSPLAAWAAAVQAATDLYSADLLEALYEDWCYFERERLRRLLFSGLEGLSAAYATLGQGARAVETAQRLLSHDPLREETHRTLMSLYASLGDRANAIRQFESCREVLARELDVAPMGETVALYEQIMRDPPRAAAAPPSDGLHAPIPAPAPAQSAPRRLPIAPTPLVGVAPLVGRAEALDFLTAQWERAQRGAGCFVVVSGEAGVGKTRLLAEFINAAAPPRLLVGRSAETERLTPYFPLVDALRGELPATPGSLAGPLATLAPVWLAEVARLLPEIRLLRPDVPAPAQVEPSQERLRLIEGLTQCICALADRPTLLLLDDLHWADETTLAWLEHLRRRLDERPAPLLLVAVTRSEGRPAGLDRLCRRLRREGWREEVTLGRLSADEVGEMVRGLAGMREGATLFSRRLHQETGGNPLFVLETLRALMETGLLHQESHGWRTTFDATTEDYRELPLPRTVREVIAARLGRLSEGAAQIIGAAAVLGREFEFGLLCQVSGRSDEAVVGALDELERAQIISEIDAGGADLFYTFGHDKFREVAYDELSHARRRLLHRRAGEALAERARGRRSPESWAGQLAHHFRAAHEFERAATFCLQGGDAAAVAHAYAEATALYRTAIDCLGALAPTPERQRQSVEATLRLYRVGFYILRADDLLAYLDPAEQQATTVGDPVLLAQVWLAQAGAFYIQGRFTAALPILERLLPMAELSQNEMLLAFVCNILGQLLALRGEYRRAVTTLERAIPLMERLTGPIEVIVSRAMVAATHAYMGDFAPAETEVRALIARAEEADDLAASAAALGFLEAILALQGRWAEAEAAGQEAIRRARQAANHIHEYVGYVFLGLPLAAQGRLAEGIAAQQKAVELAERAGSWVLLGRAYGWLGALLGEDGQEAEALRTAAHGQRLAEAHGYLFDAALCRRVLGELALGRGDHPTARTHLAAAAATFRQLEARPELARAMRAQARLAHATADPAAATLLDEAEAEFAALGMAWDRATIADLRAALAPTP